MAVIAVVNQKGGVGKTVTTVTLAAGAALAGRDVLVIDLDPQGNVADSLGLMEGNDLIQSLDDARIYDHVAREPHLYVMRSDKRTASYKATLAGRPYREMVLVDTLDDQESYDLVFIDCAPSVDILHVAALAAADWIVVPTRLDQFAVKGVGETLVSLAAVNKRRRDNPCRLAGIIPTFFDTRTNETQIQLKNLVEAFGASVWPVIPQDSKIRTANKLGQTLYEHAPKSRALAGYEQVLERLLDVVK